MKLVHKDIEKNGTGLAVLFVQYVQIAVIQASGIDSGRIRGYVAPVQSHCIR